VLKISALVSRISQDLHAAVRFAQETGLDGLDIDVVWEQPVERMAGTEDAKSLVKVLKNEGLTTFCLATKLFKSWLNSEGSIQEDFRCLEKCLDLAEALHCPLVRCYSFRRAGDIGVYLPGVIERLTAAAEIASRRGITLGIQNDAMTYLGTGRSVGNVIRSIGNPYLKSIWDPCATLYDRDDPEIPYPDGFRCVQPYLAHLMLRDADRHKYRGALCEVEFGEGLIDFRRQIKTLQDDEFAGALSFVTQWHPGMDWDTSLDESDFTERGGQAALRICLANLTKMMSA
jgi:sugar phosphate isomerase/epimerase